MSHEDDFTYFDQADEAYDELKECDSRMSDIRKGWTDRYGLWHPIETTVTDPDTGGRKGQKLARFDMIPSDVLWELAEHYGKGESKYPSDETGLPNWQRGYDWRLSVAALERHLHQFLQGQDADPETGSSHLVAVIWHAIALRWFQLHDKGTDYRGVING